MRLRESYGCDCNGTRPVGRFYPRETDEILNTIERITGDAPLMCPWRAFHDPFVRRVYEAHPYFEKGCLESFCPNPSNRLLGGISHLENVLNRIQAAFREDDKKNEDD